MIGVDLPQEALLIRTLVELADNLVEDFDVVDVLTMLSDRCVEALDVASAGVELADANGKLQVIASSSEAMRILQLLELQVDEGPCIESFRTATAIVNVSLESGGQRWPRYAPLALDGGFRSVHALPMRLRGRTIGALNLSQHDTRPLEGADILAAQALADVATIAILQHETATDAQTLTDQLSEALNSRIIIEQAKGKMSEAAGLDMEEAFQWLRAHARSHNLRLTNLCRSVADGALPTAAINRSPAKRNT
jgi:GAF domain-containing protein